MAVEKSIASSGLVEVIDRILDKGIVIEAWTVPFQILALEIFTLEARVAVVSIDTYLKYAEAVGLVPLDRPHHVTEYVTRGREIAELSPWP